MWMWLAAAHATVCSEPISRVLPEDGTFLPTNGRVHVWTPERPAGTFHLLDRTTGEPVPATAVPLSDG